MKKVFIFVLTIAALFTQCSKERENNLSDEVNFDAEQVVASVDVYSQNGILVFKNSDALSNYIEKHYLLSFDELTADEEKLGFLSQKRIFDIVADADSNHDRIMEEKYSHLEDKESLILRPEVIHSELYYKYVTLGVLREVKDQDGSSYMDYCAALPEKAPVLNIDGVYAIQDTLYQITENTYKVWYNADFDNPERIIKAIESDSTVGLFVVSFNGNGIQTKSTSVDPYVVAPWVVSGKNRALMSLRYKAVWNFSTSKPNIHYSINTQYQQKNWLGNWKFNGTCAISVSAAWSFYQGWFNGNSQGFSCNLNPNPVYAPQANNWWFSVEPSTGITMAPEYYFYVNMISPGSLPPGMYGMITEYSWGLQNFSLAANIGGLNVYINTPAYLTTINIY